MGDNPLTGLASNIENSDNYTQENKGEVYTAPNGMRINIADQEGANDVVNSLRGATISRGENIVPQQPPHGEGNPKYKSMGGDTPSLPTAPRESFNDKDYRNPSNRNNSNYGPVEATPKMSDSLGNHDAIAKGLRGEDQQKAGMDELKKDLTKETPAKPFFDLEFGSEGDEEVKKRDLHQEALDRNKKANEGFTGNFSQKGTDALRAQDRFKSRDPHQEALDSNNKANEGFTGNFSEKGTEALRAQDRFAEMAKENAQLQERLAELEKQFAEMNKQYDDPQLLDDSLDPNNPRSLNPLEEVQATLLKEQEQKQIDFANQVAEEDRLHNPLNPLYVAPITPAPVTPIVTTPEITPVTPEVIITPEEQKKQRDFKTAALIAGIVAGGAAGILGGAAVGVPVAAAAGVVSIGGRITNFFLGRSLAKIETQKNDPTLDSETRERLNKREINLKKIQNVVQHITKFATGAALGAGISSFISNVAMGGHGLIWNKPELPGGIPGGAEGSLGNTNIGQTEPTAPGGETPIPQTPEALPTENYDLFANGQVNLDGSAMNGWRLADVPSYYNNVPLEQIPASEFANSGSKAFQIFIENLRNTGISNAQLNEVPRVVLHKVLADGAYNQTNILEALQSMGYLK